jgi:hypothetical protein
MEEAAPTTSMPSNADTMMAVSEEQAAILDAAVAPSSAVADVTAEPDADLEAEAEAEPTETPIDQDSLQETGQQDDAVDDAEDNNGGMDVTDGMDVTGAAEEDADNAHRKLAETWLYV